jgi:hypothetical protein
VPTRERDGPIADSNTRRGFAQNPAVFSNVLFAGFSRFFRVPHRALLRVFTYVRDDIF